MFHLNFRYNDSECLDPDTGHIIFPGVMSCCYDIGKLAAYYVGDYERGMCYAYFTKEGEKIAESLHQEPFYRGRVIYIDNGDNPMFIHNPHKYVFIDEHGFHCLPDAWLIGHEMLGYFTPVVSGRFFFDEDKADALLGKLSMGWMRKYDYYIPDTYIRVMFVEPIPCKIADAMFRKDIDK
ncbi:hypothetical protein FACS1894170_09010 [Planctomycetales bacterium]|nr:hypothetical protein FACS1894170_09010 [Planctomycetales bacterium]